MFKKLKYNKMCIELLIMIHELELRNISAKYASKLPWIYMLHAPLYICYMHYYFLKEISELRNMTCLLEISELRNMTCLFLGRRYFYYVQVSIEQVGDHVIYFLVNGIEVNQKLLHIICIGFACSFMGALAVSQAYLAVLQCCTWGSA